MMDFNKIKELREKTGVSITQCKAAMEEAGDDMDRAIEILRKKGEKVADKKSVREIKSGLIETYVHGNGKIGVMLELGCETDFVAKNNEFKDLAHDVAMHIAAMNPKYLRIEDVPEEVIKAEKNIYREQLKDSDKPDNILEQIIEGKIKKFSAEKSLLAQPFIKNPDTTIEGLLRDKILKMGENIQIRRFARYEI
ncbi:MAG: elongation factor Ts [Parcubacteria group bacterium GW2011_GWA2_38_13b]|nr:MAG: elongation factor Ts [Parcubacteria group bacterium GW2011_GWA2_38_13b]